ncbi:MAG: PIG-L family deacetylase [Dermatophilaceae bacterium]
MPHDVTGAGEAPRLLVTVAHPDDETFGCGSLLLHAGAAGAVTCVLCATRGDAGQPAPGSGVRPEQLAAVRERELREAAALLGVSRVELLGFADSGMAGDADEGTLVGEPLDSVRDQVRACIEDFRPHVLVTLDGGDGHRDHERIRDATLAAAEVADWPVQRVYLHCFPRSLLQRWLEHMAQHNPSSEHLEAQVGGTPEELITTVIDTARHLPARERAMAAHVSQVSPFEGLPPDLRMEFLTAERLQRVIPAWTGGPREHDVFAAPASRP